MTVRYVSATGKKRDFRKFNGLTFTRYAVASTKEEALKAKARTKKYLRSEINYNPPLIRIVPGTNNGEKAYWIWVR